MEWSARYGNAATIGSIESVVGELPVLRRTELYADDVKAVAEGHALALVIENYYPPEACRKMSARLMEAGHLWFGYPPEVNADHIRILGTPLYNCLGKEFSEDCEEYWREAPRRNRALRAASGSLIYPADKVRVELDNDWPGGASLLRVGGKPAFFGLARLSGRAAVWNPIRTARTGTFRARRPHVSRLSCF
jgi:hypothetical protein